jgi:hypothetical protein
VVESCAADVRFAAGGDVTLVWFVIWFISDRVGDREPLTFNPVNAWAWTLMLVIALDLTRQHVTKRHGH